MLDALVADLRVEQGDVHEYLVDESRYPWLRVHTRSLRSMGLLLAALSRYKVRPGAEAWEGNIRALSSAEYHASKVVSRQHEFSLRFPRGGQDFSRGYIAELLGSAPILDMRRPLHGRREGEWVSTSLLAAPTVRQRARRWTGSRLPRKRGGTRSRFGASQTGKEPGSDKRDWLPMKLRARGNADKARRGLTVVNAGSALKPGEQSATV